MTTIEQESAPTTGAATIHDALAALDVDLLAELCLSFAGYRDRAPEAGAPLMANVFGAIAAEAVSILHSKVDALT
jgi:hypothetical protein